MNLTDARPATDRIVLDMGICDQRRGYRVTFEGLAAEDMALAFVQVRWSTHAVSEAEDAPFDYEAFPRLYDLLYPTCEHGLSLSNCYGPQHYYFDQEEQARGYVNC